MHLAHRGLSQAEFARRVNCTPGWPSNIQSGRQKPPKDEDELAKWGRALALNDEEMDEFIELALLEHSPKKITERFLKMKSELTARASKKRG